MQALSKLKERFHQQDTKFKHENAELTDEYQRITGIYARLDLKMISLHLRDRHLSSCSIYL
jgi:hypothetical protein